MQINNQIKPYNPNHSIKEAVISVFLSNPIIKPLRFKSLIETDFKDKFQQFEPLKQIKFKFLGEISNSNRPEQHITEEAGFRFSHFENGIKKTVLQGLNEDHRQFISFHSFEYTSWKDFLNNFKFAITSLSNFQSDLFVTAISLHYIDEFNWIDSSNPIDSRVIFNQTSKIIPLIFYNSINSQFNLITEHIENNKKYFNRIEISTESNFSQIIQISHNISQALDDVITLKDLISLEILEEILSTAHSKNKELLQDILTPEIKELINLKS